MAKNKIITGAALTVLQSLESDSVDCCITSPPYYGLRDYGMEGQQFEDELAKYPLKKKE